jgi:IS605 OrfB family transposase
VKTIVFKINIAEEEIPVISKLQNEYSMSFRKLYNNIELMEDKNFLDSLLIKSKKQIDYLKKEVEAFYDRNKANKNKILDNISELENKKEKLNLKQFRHLQYLKKSYGRKVIFGNTKELKKISKGEGDIEKWKNSRLLPLIFYGDASSYGNRFFKLETIKDGNIIFKPESTKIRININFNPKKHIKELNLLQNLILIKKIPVTVKLSKDLIMFTYDESILYGTKLDLKSFYKEIKNVKEEDKRKKLISNKHKEHEKYLKTNKLERYLAIDLNPDGIGYSVLNKDTSLVDKGYLDISKVLKANKRKYETSILIKEIFKLIKHYKCSYIVIEELNLKNKDHGNKVSNRKINNLWNRELINELIHRRCNETGTILIEINPVYTSFIGNILNNEYDPIAASMEIGRKGIFKYGEGGFYPELNITNFINDERYDEIKECLTWKDMYKLFTTSKWSYRRKLNDFNFTGFYLGNEKSRCKHLHFS